eukprot:912161-Rhodomonas_salina.1
MCIRDRTTPAPPVSNLPPPAINVVKGTPGSQAGSYKGYVTFEVVCDVGTVALAVGESPSSGLGCDVATEQSRVEQSVLKYETVSAICCDKGEAS